VAVLAHEIGHFKCRHILRSLALSILTSGGLFFLLSKFLASPALFEAFGVSHPSTYAGVIFLLVVFSPFFRLMGLFTHALSRRYEFEADDYSARTYGKPESLVSALKKLSVDSLSHLTPHRLKILLDYTHPPVMERISALRARGPRRHD
ncbi:MAG: M48 family metalloprotease, partial [Bdellovibrionota bacterium]